MRAGAALCAEGLAVPGQIILPLRGYPFCLPKEWQVLSDWCTEDVSARCSEEALVVHSAKTLRNAMHSALVLAAAGGLLDAVEFPAHAVQA